MQRLHNMRRMLSRNLVALLFNLAHLLANPVIDSTAEVHLNPTEATTSLDFKHDTTGEPLPSSLLVTANSRFKTQGTLTTGSPAFSTSDNYPLTTGSPAFSTSDNYPEANSRQLTTGSPAFATSDNYPLTTGSPAFTTSDNYPQANSRQPGRDIYASQTTSEWSSIVKTQADETNQSHGNAVNSGDASSQANHVMTSDSTTPHYLDGLGPDSGLIQGNNQTSFNKNTTLKSKSTGGGNVTSPKHKRDWNFLSCHPSRLVCFVTLWVLGVTASVFFGLTICLWVQLSVRQRRRVSVEGRETMRGVILENLWVANKSTVEQRAEFWYSRGDLEGEERGTEHRSGRREHKREGKEEQLLAQPKVTLKDITEFWYLNGRPSPEDHTS